MQKTLIIIGLAIVLAGLAWPLLSQLPLGRLPGDIIIRREGFKFYFPVTTMILFSLAVSFLLWLYRQF